MKIPRTSLACSLRLDCPHCSQRLEGSAELAGRELTCPTCQQIFRAPPPAAARPALRRLAGITGGSVAAVALGLALWLAARAGTVSVTRPPTVAMPASPTADLPPRPQAVATAEPASSSVAAKGAAPAAPVGGLPDWVDAALPERDEQGWMTVFDGKRLRGVDPGHPNFAKGNLFLKGSLLVMDASSGWNGGVSVRWRGTNAAVRVRGRNVSSQNLGAGIGSYCAWVNGREDGLCGIGQTLKGVYKDIRIAKIRTPPDDFFDLEFRLHNGTLALLVNGALRAQTRAPWVDEIRSVNLSCLNGVAVVEKIEMRSPP